jgi:hypothetical protein
MTRKHIKVNIVCCGQLDIAMARQSACRVVAPLSNISALLIPEEKSTSLLPEHTGVKIRPTIPVGLGPLLLPICVPKNGSPFVDIEGWGAMFKVVLDFMEEQEVVIIVDPLILGLTTPEEVNWRKCEVTRGLLESEVKMADVADGMFFTLLGSPGTNLVVSQHW